MYIYHALINALSAHMIHINLNMILVKKKKKIKERERKKKRKKKGVGGGDLKNYAEPVKHLVLCLLFI